MKLLILGSMPYTRGCMGGKGLHGGLRRVNRGRDEACTKHAYAINKTCTRLIPLHQQEEGV